MQALDSTTPGAFRTVAARVAAEAATIPLVPDLAEPRADLGRKIAAFQQ